MGIPYAEVIGDPIDHSKSPIIHKFWLCKLGLGGDYRRLRVPPAELETYLSSRRADPDWRGCNVTYPHKERIAALVDRVENPRIGAANCVVPEAGMLVGYNTDGEGIEYGIDYELCEGPAACVIGAGGAAAAAVETLYAYCASSVRLIARNLGKAEALLRRLGAPANVFPFEASAEAIRNSCVLVNATPLGMTGFPPMRDEVLTALTGLTGERRVVDLVYTPLATELLIQAERLGFATADGLTVLVGQASGSFCRFFGHARYPEVEPELRELLTR